MDLRITVPAIAAIFAAGSALFAVHVWFPIWIVLLVGIILIPIALASCETPQDGVALGTLIISFIFMVCWNILHWVFILTEIFGK